MNLRQAAQQALEALEKVKTDADKQPPVYPWDIWRMWVDRAITNLRAALAEPECKCTMRQKMVGDGCAVCNPERAKDLAEPEQNPFDGDAERYARKLHEEREYYKALFTAPTPRKPLTDDEIVDIWAGVSMGYDDQINIIELGRAIERAHGIGEQT